MGRKAIFLGAAVTLGLWSIGCIGQETSSSPSPSSTVTTPSPQDRSADAETKHQSRSNNSQSDHDRKWRLKLGTVSVGAGYISGPFFSPYGLNPFDGLYRTSLWEPYWGGPFGYPLGYFDYRDSKGEVKVTLAPKTIVARAVEVYVDNAFAGTADHLKNIWLEPGAYDLAVASPGRVPFHRRIYVLSGRSLKIVAQLDSQQPGTSEAKP